MTERSLVSREEEEETQDIVSPSIVAYDFHVILARIWLFGLQAWLGQIVPTNDSMTD